MALIVDSKLYGSYRALKHFVAYKDFTLKLLVIPVRHLGVILCLDNFTRSHSRTTGILVDQKLKTENDADGTWPLGDVINQLRVTHCTLFI